MVPVTPFGAVERMLSLSLGPLQGLQLVCPQFDSEAQAANHTAILLSHILNVLSHLNCAKSLLIPSQMATF